MNQIDGDSPLNQALRQFDATEANILKLEKLLAKAQELTPSGVEFGGHHDYEEVVRQYQLVLDALPKIDGWKPSTLPVDLDGLAQSRFDAQELGEPSAFLAVENSIDEPGHELQDYRFRFKQKRRELVRDSLNDLIGGIDSDVQALRRRLRNARKKNNYMPKTAWHGLKNKVNQIAFLIGSDVHPPGWSNLQRHLHFGMVGDFDDIEKHDWPSVREGIRARLYGEDEPVPVATSDLSNLTRSKPQGTVATKLRWDQLSSADFERLIFSLILNETGYENPEWLMQTNAPDRGRDLSVYRVLTDSLSGVSRKRVLIQCKHWQGKSISPNEISALKERISLWEPPRVDVVVVATSGRFTADAVALIEKQNQSSNALSIEMWAESHLERLLASRPALIAEFGLR